MKASQGTRSRAIRQDRDQSGDEDQQVQTEAKALSDRTRYAIFKMIQQAAEALPVADLTARLGLNHNAIRQHLAVLVRAGLVVEEVEHGRRMPGRPRLLYSPDPHSRRLFKTGGSEGHYRHLASLLAEALSNNISPLEAGRAAGARSGGGDARTGSQAGAGAGGTAGTRTRAGVGASAGTIAGSAAASGSRSERCQDGRAGAIPGVGAGAIAGAGARTNSQRRAGEGAIRDGGADTPGRATRHNAARDKDEVPPSLTLKAVLAGMKAYGFEPRLSRTGDGIELIVDTCPYIKVAIAVPDVVCDLHRGVAEGAAGAAGDLVVAGFERYQAHRGCRLLLAPRSAG